MDPYEPLHPEFAPRLIELQRLLRQYGLDTDISSGLRTPQQQQALYAQGRTAPGPIVTGAPAGSSYHNYGAAADIVPRGMDEVTAGHLVGQIIRENPQLGLTWGGKFSNIYDPFHVQLGVPIGQTKGGPSGLPAFPESGEAAAFGGAARPGYVPDVVPQTGTMYPSNMPPMSPVPPQVPQAPPPVAQAPQQQQPFQFRDFFKGPLSPGNAAIDFGSLVRQANRYG